MNNQQILITGGSGQLGLALQKQFPGAIPTDSAELDITDRAAVENFDWDNIRIIINAAAYTNVDGAETPEGKALAEKINVEGVKNLADMATQHDLTLIHLSSDYVFDGTKENHLETEGFHPLSVYGQTKADADTYIMANTPKYYILRTSWLIGEGKNFVRTMLELGAKGISPKVVNDQSGRLTFTSELVRIIAYLLEKQAPYGVYNASNDGPVKSWYEITRDIFQIAGYTQAVTGITTAEYFIGKENIAHRPTHSDFDLDKLHAIGLQSTDWETELADYIQTHLA
jgi:dTDP-4-dehydrorhamnose 3,5-epimerase